MRRRWGSLHVVIVTGVSATRRRRFHPAYIHKDHPFLLVFKAGSLAVCVMQCSPHHPARKLLPAHSGVLVPGCMSPHLAFYVGYGDLTQAITHDKISADYLTSPRPYQRADTAVTRGFLNIPRPSSSLLPALSEAPSPSRLLGWRFERHESRPRPGRGRRWQVPEALAES